MIGIFGAGAFGTALAVTLAQDGTHVLLGGRDARAIADMEKFDQNRKYLPDVSFPDALQVTRDNDALSQCDILLFAVPAQNLRDAFSALMPRNMLVLCAKGIEQATGLLQSQIAEEFLPRDQIAVLSGPSFASEIAISKPTALSIACANPTKLKQVQSALSRKNLRLYANEDVLGVQIGGALKNVYSIACGIAAGANLGESARASLMTRSFAEMARFAEFSGAERATLFGLSGFGDLVLSASSKKSRNFSYGFEAAEKGAFEPDKTVEGIATTHALARIADDNQIDLPICQNLSAFLRGSKTLPEISDTLLSRPLKDERA